LALMLLVSIGMSCFAVKWKRVQERRAAVEAIIAMGANVSYKHQRDNWDAEPPGPACLRRILGRDFFAEVDSVVLHPKSEVHLGPLAILSELRYLRLNFTSVSDGELEHIKDLKKLETVYAAHTPLTDAGLVHLEGLEHLKYLSLGNTRISGSGLRHLKRLSQLEELCLFDTRVTDDGVKHLRGLTQLRVLLLQNTKVTDAALKQLETLEHLESLSVWNTSVTHEGAHRYEEARPRCYVNHTGW
jgi:hypothetical protein